MKDKIQPAEPNDIVSFGYWVQLRRLALDLTRPALAQRVNCSPDTIKKIERDERRPSHQIAEILALAWLWLKIWRKYPKALYLAHLNVSLEVSIRGLYMTYIPQIEPITTLKKNHLSVLKKLTNGPVFLSQRSKMAAVLLSTHEFEVLMKDATQYRRMLLADQHSQEMNEGQFVTQEAFEAGLKERGLS